MSGDSPYRQIILCGRRCTGKTTLFWQLQEQLSWPVFSISQYLRDYIRTHKLTSADEISEHDQVMGREIDRRVGKLILANEKVIIDARIYAFIRQSCPTALKVLLTADDSARAVRSAGREGTTVERALPRITAKEEKWIIEMNERYGFDSLDPKWYDLVIDTTTLTPEAVLQQVMARLATSEPSK